MANRSSVFARRARARPFVVPRPPVRVVVRARATHRFHHRSTFRPSLAPVSRARDRARIAPRAPAFVVATGAAAFRFDARVIAPRPPSAASAREVVPLRTLASMAFLSFIDRAIEIEIAVSTRTQRRSIAIAGRARARVPTDRPPTADRRRDASRRGDAEATRRRRDAARQRDAVDGERARERARTSANERERARTNANERAVGASTDRRRARPRRRLTSCSLAVGLSKTFSMDSMVGATSARSNGEVYERRDATMRRDRARSIAIDLILFASTFGIGAWLEVATPHQRFIQGDLLWRYSYPHGENTVPAVVVPLIAFVVPLICMLLMPKRLNPAVHKERAIGGLCASVGLTWVVTCAMKNIIGGIRPDFVARCWPDGNQVWASVGVPSCSGVNDVVQQGRRSFPSGHTSMSFSGFVYCSLYLAAWLKIGGQDRRLGRWEGIWKLVIVLAPTILAGFIGLTRIRDYWHHWEDVTVGALLGSAFAYAAWVHKRPYAKRVTLETYSPLGLMDDEATSCGGQ
jgi:membrane-associated phospholipid phosphatase